MFSLPDPSKHPGSLSKRRGVMKRYAVVFAFLTGVSIAFSQGGSPFLFNVRDFGAVGDGITLDTKAIQRAIDECARGGGIVVFSPGTYLTGSLDLRSNVELQVQMGAVVLGSKNLSDYSERIPKLKSYNDVFLKHSLFYAEGQSNISITGKGRIDGQGGSFKVVTKEKPARYRNRPFLVRFVECKNVTVEDVTLENSAMWMQQYLACEGVMIRGIRVFNHANKNNDMMDIDGCRNVVIADCIGDTDDDGITLKSTSERLTENVTISNCVISSHCNAIKTGTESTGGFRNIAINNVVVKPSSVESPMSGKRGGVSGISLTLVDGGIMDGVSISNVVIDGPEVPLFVRLGNRARKHWDGAPQPRVGSVSNISLSHIVARNAKSVGCSITGLPGHAINGIQLSDIRITFSGAVKTMPTIEIDERADQYPEATMWGALPSYGFFLRHLRQLRVRDLEIGYEQEDVRPALMLSDVTDATIENLRAAISGGAGAALVLERVQDLMITGTSLRGTTKSVLKLLGKNNARITLTGNDLRSAEQVCEPLGALGVAVHVIGDQMSR